MAVAAPTGAGQNPAYRPACGPFPHRFFTQLGAADHPWIGLPRDWRQAPAVARISRATGRSRPGDGGGTPPGRATGLGRPEGGFYNFLAE